MIVKNFGKEENILKNVSLVPRLIFIKMAVLSLVDVHKEDLNFLQQLSPQIVGDFCKLAWNYLIKGVNMKMYQSASQKLQLDVKQIQAGVEGLANLFVETAKNELTKEEFQETLTELGFSEQLSEVIYSEYLNQKNILLSSLPHAGVQHPEFKDLEWRFETQVSSRSIKSQILPRVVMKFDFEKGGQTESICLQSDIPNVIHMSQVISQALQDSKTQHSKRIQRALT